MTRVAKTLRHAADLAAHPPARRSAMAPYVLPQVLALAASAAVFAIGSSADSNRDAMVWGFLALAFAGLRIATIRTDLVPSTYVLDAIGVTVFISGTGDVRSPFLAMALAGAWWAGQKGGRGSLYGLAFSAAYLLLVGPQAARDGELAAVIYQPVFVCAIGIFADRLRAVNLLADVPPAAFNGIAYEQRLDSVQAGLNRAIAGEVVPIDALLTAGQLGLSASQTELLPYLMLGLSNQQIADALSVSEPTVRYRLTRLYRCLGVKGRKAAAERARELGLAALLRMTTPDAT